MEHGDEEAAEGGVVAGVEGEVLAVFEAELLATGEQHREVLSGVRTDLRAAHHQNGVVEQRAIAFLPALKLMKNG